MRVTRFFAPLLAALAFSASAAVPAEAAQVPRITHETPTTFNPPSLEIAPGPLLVETLPGFTYTLTRIDVTPQQQVTPTATLPAVPNRPATILYALPNSGSYTLRAFLGSDQKATAPITVVKV